jgi:membrane protease YdiL (CAAX protease family)
LAAYGGLLGIGRYVGLRLSDIGSAGPQARAAAGSAVKVVVMCWALLIVAYRVAPGLFTDGRYRQPVRRALYEATVRLPFRTVLFEEIVFRGMLPAMLQRVYPARSVQVISAVLFGLWHLPTASEVDSNVRRNKLMASRVAMQASVCGVTTFAGLVLQRMRNATCSVLVPMAAHWAVNAGGRMLSALGWVRRD